MLKVQDYYWYYLNQEVDPNLEIELGEMLLKYDKLSKEFKEARNYLVESNIKLVFYVACKLSEEITEDEIQDGIMGLLKAAENFNYKLARFSTYAIPFIKNAIIDGYNRYSFIKIPPQIRKDMKRMNKIISDHLNQFGQAISDEALASLMNVNLKYIKFLNIIPTCLNIPSDVNIDNFTIHQDYESENIDISSKLSILGEREKEIVCLYLGIDHDRSYTFKEIALIYNLSSEGVRKIYNKAITKMKENSNAI